MCNRLHTIQASGGRTEGRTDRQIDGQTSCHGIVHAMDTHHAVKIAKFTHLTVILTATCDDLREFMHNFALLISADRSCHFDAQNMDLSSFTFKQKTRHSSVKIVS